MSMLFSFFAASSKAQGDCSTRALCKVLRLLQITRMREILTLFASNEDANEYQLLLDKFQSTNKVLWIDIPS